MKTSSAAALAGEQIGMRNLNVDGTRLVIFAVAMADAPPDMPAELGAVFGSVQIQP